MPLRQLLGIEHPIIQAPMVGVSTPALAVAVSEAGALGSIGLGASNPAQARELIAQVRALTARLVNFNLFCHRPAVADAQREAASARMCRKFAAYYAAAGMKASAEALRHNARVHITTARAILVPFQQAEIR